MEEMKSVDAKYEMAITNLELELARLVGQKDSMIEGVNKELAILGEWMRMVIFIFLEEPKK